MADKRETSSTGISNRESSREEARERAEHPPLNPDSRLTDDTDRQDVTDAAEAGQSSEQRQTSNKAGSRSTAQKDAASPYAERTMPAAAKVPGAFGEEPEEPAE